jgi:hypothetical protein
LDAFKAVAVEARDAGPPCSDCHFRTLLGMCGNPAYAEQKFEPSTGSYSESFFTPIATARAPDGLCGPEALLFEPLGSLVETAKGVGRGVRTVLAYVSGAIIVLGLASQLLG